MLAGPHWSQTIADEYYAWRLEALALGFTYSTEHIQLNHGLRSWRPRPATVGENYWLNAHGRYAHVMYRKGAASGRGQEEERV